MKATTGERCPSCGKMDSKIIDTRMENGYRKRRREVLGQAIAGRIQSGREDVYGMCIAKGGGE